jgi:hypothetical protein
LLAFLAVTSSSDVLARSIAAAGQQKAMAPAVTTGRLIPFDAPLPGRWKKGGATGHVDVQVLAAAQGEGTLFLVKEDGSPLEWVKASEIKIP